MHPSIISIIKEMVAVLRPVIKNRDKAGKLLEGYWSDKMALIWTSHHIHRAANERELALTEAEACAVLRDLHDHHNHQYGIKWQDVIENIEDRVIGRKLTKRELDRFIHEDIITVNKRKKPNSPKT